MTRTLLCRAGALVALVALVYAGACGGSHLGDRPPELVGDWNAMRKGSLWRTSLMANGRFKSRPDDPNAGASTEGEWGVTDGKISWSYTDSESRIKTVLAGADETSVIVKSEKDTFEVVEKDGSRTVFTRQKPPGAPTPPAPITLPEAVQPPPPPQEPSESLEVPPPPY